MTTGAKNREKRQREVYEPKEVAEILGVGLNLVYRQLRAGTIPGVRVGGKYVISRQAFKSWLEGHGESQ